MPNDRNAGLLLQLVSHGDAGALSPLIGRRPCLALLRLVEILIDRAELDEELGERLEELCGLLGILAEKPAQLLKDILHLGKTRLELLLALRCPVVEIVHDGAEEILLR
eukprot:CAMPEP_0183341770 /NCGR_PEP_ID=MMETSP0164_2-20130417/7992_1 /TAXON_ID=221442 /ORGANISM="Coccolithus pelagicus ssp braarudi, Strain PLY182g" /LENGTH=108 /DNA_ID=CAMNT_0025512181 /DNA_START=160 /DNA_END=482 /DNA_ORIENTATION=-